MAGTANAKIGRYEIVGQLATGGMAEILLARLVGPSGFERLVVLKRMLPHLAKGAAMREMFVEEARILAGIRHANVVQVEELAAEQGEPFLAMEYLEGESAAGLLRRLVAQRKKLAPDLAAYVVAETCAGLHAAHELTAPDGTPRGLVHRDVSPQNVFLGYDGSVKVLDFGIAKAKDHVTRTETGQLKGKFQYMSPEQTRGEDLDRRSDVFSLGVVFYELATTRSLFHRRTHLLTMQAICEEPITPPSRVAPQLPKPIDAVCMRSLKRDRDARYATTSAMRKDLLPLANVAGADEPKERLAALMRELFADRIAEKAEMVRRVREGNAVTELPAGDADELVSVPSVLDVIPASARRRPSGGRAGWIAAACVAAVALLVIAIVARSRSNPSPTTAAASVTPSVAAPSATTASMPTTLSGPDPADAGGPQLGTPSAAKRPPTSPATVRRPGASAAPRGSFERFD